MQGPYHTLILKYTLKILHEGECLSLRCLTERYWFDTRIKKAEISGNKWQNEYIHSWHHHLEYRHQVSI